MGTEESPTFTCPACDAPLAIEGPWFDTSSRIDAETFMRLPYSVSSNAQWTCPNHGAIDRVRIAVIDDHVSYVEPTAET